MLASKSKAISPWNKDNKERASSGKSSGSVPNKSWQRTAMEKLRKHPSSDDWGHNQLAMEAKDLTDHDSIMSTYFSEILHHQVLERVEEQQQEREAEFVTSTEVQASRERYVPCLHMFTEPLWILPTLIYAQNQRQTPHKNKLEFMLRSTVGLPTTKFFFEFQQQVTAVGLA